MEVDLALDAPTVALRNERLPMCETELPFAPQYVLAHRRAPDGVLRKLFPGCGCRSVALYAAASAGLAHPLSISDR